MMKRKRGDNNRYRQGRVREGGSSNSRKTRIKRMKMRIKKMEMKMKMKSSNRMITNMLITSTNDNTISLY